MSNNFLSAGGGTIGFVQCDQIDSNPFVSFFPNSASSPRSVYSAKSLNPTKMLTFNVLTLSANNDGSYDLDTDFIGELAIHLRFVKYG